MIVPFLLVDIVSDSPVRGSFVHSGLFSETL